MAGRKGRHSGQREPSPTRRRGDEHGQHRKRASEEAGASPKRHHQQDESAVEERRKASEMLAVMCQLAKQAGLVEPDAAQWATAPVRATAARQQRRDDDDNSADSGDAPPPTGNSQGESTAGHAGRHRDRQSPSAAHRARKDVRSTPGDRTTKQQRSVRSLERDGTPRSSPRKGEQPNSGSRKGHAGSRQSDDAVESSQSPSESDSDVPSEHTESSSSDSDANRSTGVRHTRESARHKAFVALERGSFRDIGKAAVTAREQDLDWTSLVNESAAGELTAEAAKHVVVRMPAAARLGDQPRAVCDWQEADESFNAAWGDPTREDSRARRDQAVFARSVLETPTSRHQVMAFDALMRRYNKVGATLNKDDASHDKDDVADQTTARALGRSISRVKTLARQHPETFGAAWTIELERAERACKCLFESAQRRRRTRLFNTGMFGDRRAVLTDDSVTDASAMVLDPASVKEAEEAAYKQATVLQVQQATAAAAAAQQSKQGTQASRSDGSARRQRSSQQRAPRGKNFRGGRGNSGTQRGGGGGQSNANRGGRGGYRTDRNAQQSSKGGGGGYKQGK